MKRKLIAISLLAALLVSCGKESATENTTKPDTSATTETTVEEQTEQPAADSAPEYTVTSVSADGYDYFEGRIECLQITDGQHEKLAKAIDEFFSKRVSDFNSSVDSYNKDSEEQNKEMKKSAEENGDTYETIKYSDNVTVSVVRADNQVFSFKIYDYIYLGGAHGGTNVTGYTFDSKTGEQLTIDSFGDKASIANTADIFILNSIAESSDQARAGLFDDDALSYVTAIDDYFTKTELPAYYLSNRGIVFVFQQYDIAPYASGIIEFVVPYTQFEDFNKAYIPEDGFYSEDLSGLGLIARIDVNDDGELDTVAVATIDDSDNNSYGYEITVGNDTVKEKRDEYVYTAGHYIHTTSGNYILVECSGESYTLYDVTNGIKKLGSINSAVTIKEIKDGEIILAEATYTETGITWGEPEVHKYSKNGIE